MSLAKTWTQIFDGREQSGLHIHDLYLEYCRRSADRRGEKKERRRRLLNGHMIRNASLTESDTGDDVEGPLGLKMLEYEPRPWWKDEVHNKCYIRKHLSRHLRCAGLDLELGATMLDLRWMSAQGCAGGVLDLRNDLDILKKVVDHRHLLQSRMCLVSVL